MAHVRLVENGRPLIANVSSVPSPKRIITAEHPGLPVTAICAGCPVTTDAGDTETPVTLVATVMTAAAEIVRAPRSSMACAVIEWVPSGGDVQVAVYGLAVACPIYVAPA